MIKYAAPVVLAAILAGCGSESNVSRGEAALASGDYAEAARLFASALKTNPTSVPLLYNLGAARAMAGDTRGAIAAFRDALRCSPGEIEVSEYLADQLAKTGTPEALAEARELLDFSIPFRSEPVAKARALNSIALVEMSLRHYDLALAHLVAAISAAPDYPPAHYDLAVLCKSTLGLPAAAARELEAFLNAGGQDGERAAKAREMLAELKKSLPAPYSHKTSDAASELLRSGAELYDKKDFAKAVKLFSEASLKDPFSFDAYFNAANAHLAVGKYREAYESFLQASSINPSRFDAAFWAARLAYANGDFKTAVKDLTAKIIPSWPDEAESYLLAAYAFAQERRYIEARAFGELFLAKSKDEDPAGKVKDFKLWLETLPETRFRP